MKDKNDRLFYRKRLALSILKEFKRRGREIKITDYKDKTLTIDEAIDIVEEDILNDYLNENGLAISEYDKLKKSISERAKSMHWSMEE